MHRHVRGFQVVMTAALIAGASQAWAQTSKSASVVKEFVDLAGGEMKYVAARMPDSNDEFVAALHIPGVQVIVVVSKYEQPSLLNEMLQKRDYQGVYTDLNSASYAIAASRVFIEDLKEDGLAPKRADENSPFDSYEAGGKRVAFDGDYKRQKLSEKEYQDTFAAADEKYAKALTTLVAQLKKSS